MDEASLTKILSGAVSVARLQDYQKSVNELIEFLSRNALRTAHLDRANPKASWLGFLQHQRQVGGWKSQEEFVLRLPLDGKIFEFPFKLPQSQENCCCRNGMSRAFVQWSYGTSYAQCWQERVYGIGGSRQRRHRRRQRTRAGHSRLARNWLGWSGWNCSEKAESLSLIYPPLEKPRFARCFHFAS